MSLPLRKNVRLYVLLFSAFLIVSVYVRTVATIPADSSLQLIRLGQYYALLALAYLYTALLIGPAVYVFKWLPWRGHIYRARRAVGVSAFFLGLLHGSIEFFGLLGGFPGLPFLPLKYLIAISLSFTALVMLLLMASTSFDYMVSHLGMKRWKFLHRFIYVAGFLVVIHALMLGTHFADLNTAIPQLFFIALAFLLILEANRVDVYVAKRLAWAAPKPIALSLLAIVIVAYLYALFFAPQWLSALGLHAGH